MPKDALADFILDLDQLLGAVDSHEALDEPYLRRLRDELEATLLEIKALHAEQASLAARRQEITQRLRITRSRGQDAAIKLRSALRAHFGHRFEGLVRFRIRPVRRRSRAIPETAASLPAGTVVAPTKRAAEPEPSSASPVPGQESPEKS
jgi:hypothetical protein